MFFFFKVSSFFIFFTCNFLHNLHLCSGPSTSQTSGQLKPRTGSISSAATSHQQQIGSRSNSFNVQNTTTGLNKTGESFVSALPKPERPKTIAKAKAKISRPRLTGIFYF